MDKNNIALSIDIPSATLKTIRVEGFTGICPKPIMAAVIIKGIRLHIMAMNTILYEVKTSATINDISKMPNNTLSTRLSIKKIRALGIHYTIACDRYIKFFRIKN